MTGPGVPISRPAIDRLTAALARHPMVVVVGAAGVGKSTLLQAFAESMSWRAPRSLFDPELLQEVRAEHRAFIEMLEPRTILDDVDVDAEFPTSLARIIGANRGARHGQLVIAVSTRAALPAEFPADAIVELQPITMAERRNAGPVGPTALFAADHSTWQALPLAESDYLDLVLAANAHAAPNAAEAGTAAAAGDRAAPRWRSGLARLADRLDQVDERVLRHVTRSSGSWLVPAVLATNLDLTERAACDALGRLCAAGLIRRLAAWGRATDAGGRYVVGDLAAVAREYALGADRAAIVGQPLAILLQTLALNELLTQNDWLRRPFHTATWQPTMGASSIELVLQRPHQSPGDAVHTVAVAICPTSRLDTEVGTAALRSLHALRRRQPQSFDRLILLYLGPSVLALPGGIIAVPLSLLWTPQPQFVSLGIGPLEQELDDAIAVLRTLRSGAQRGVADLARHRQAAQARLHGHIVPLLEQVQDRLAEVGLATRVTLDQFDHLELLLPDDGSVELLTGAMLTLADPNEPHLDGWRAMMAAGLGPSGETGWWLGHLVAGLPSSAHDVVGRSGPLNSTTEDLADQLVAALVAGLADAAVHPVGTAARPRSGT